MPEWNSDKSESGAAVTVAAPTPPAAIEQLGFGALWIGGSPSVDQVRPYLEASSTLPVITGILNVWQHDPADVAAAHARITADHPDRFLLGDRHRPPGGDQRLHAPADGHAHVLRRPRRRRDAGPEGGARGAPRSARRCSISPRSARSARIPTSPRSSTRTSRASAWGRTRWSRPRSPSWSTRTRRPPAAIAREYATLYLGLSNYTRNLLDFGFTEADFADGGSDRLIDAVIPHGSPERVAAYVEAHLDAGADHVCLQPLGSDEPSRDYAALAAVLL